MNKKNQYRMAVCMSAAVIFALSGCGKKAAAEPTESFQIEKTDTIYETLAPIQIGTLPGADNNVPPETEAAPEYLRDGEEHPKVAKLQARLMELGFMDNDEPTNYYGSVTESAVKVFQRQNKLAMDGIVGSTTWDFIMSQDAKYYTVAKGDSGEDIGRIQNRLYELGYLATADLVTGNFGDTTEAAIIKLQEVNALTPDGKAGHQTINLLYSDEIKPNLLAYGDKSEVVLASQQRLKDLGYLTTTPDGTYGNDTSVAVKQFQSKNDLVVDGYLGPSTRIALNASTALPNGFGLGDQGESVERVQQLLSKLGYLNSANITGYYGEVTEKAVKQFQSTNSLSADGSVGMMTMGKLTGTEAKKAPSNSGKTGTSGGSTPKKNDSGGQSGGTTTVTGSGVDSLLSVAASKVGKPYVYGAKGPNAFDCSGFIYWCLNQVGVKQSYLTSSGWRSVGKYTKITSFSNLQAGDIIVVSGHVGIVAGGGQVIDASSSNGRVVKRSLNSWWSNNFICGWRIFG